MRYLFENKLIPLSISVFISVTLSGCKNSNNGDINETDTLPPEISIRGANPVNLVKGLNYIDAGADAIDKKDGVVSVTKSGSVDVSTPGTYSITYTAKDKAGNESSVKRIINITEKGNSGGGSADNTPPTITINGENQMTVNEGTTYNDAGASANDNVDGEVQVIVKGDVNTTIPGTYEIIYTATDKAGNTSTIKRTVLVVNQNGGSGNGNTNNNIIIDGNCVLADQEKALIIAHNNARSVSRACGGKQFSATGPLAWSCKLGTASQNHSQSMAENNFFSHTGLTGESPFDRMNDVGYQYGTAGENIAAGQRSVQSVVEGWLQSDGHCRNIMNSQFTQMGAGIATGVSANFSIYWTVGFGTPR